MTFRIIFIGPDGSGKSTLAAELRRELERHGILVLHRHFVGGKSSNNDSHSEFRPRARGFAVGFISVLYRLWRGTVVGRNAIEKSDVLIEERSFIDQFISPERYRIKESLRPLVLALHKVFFKPDLYVCLEGAPQIIAVRKGELTSRETARHIATARAITRTEPTLRIDTSTTPVDGCLEEILARCQRIRFVHIRSSLREMIPTPKRLSVYSTSAKAARNSGLYKPSRILARLTFRFISRKVPGRSVDLDPILQEALLGWSGIFREVTIMKSWGQSKFVCCSGGLHRPGRFLKVFVGNLIALGENEAKFIRLVARLNPTTFSVPKILSWKRTEKFAALETEAPIAGVSSLQVADRKTIDRVLGEIRDELGELHPERGIVHGDLSVSNIVFGPTPLVVDWEKAYFREQ